MLVTGFSPSTSYENDFFRMWSRHYQWIFSCEGAAQHLHLSLCLSVRPDVRLWSKLNFSPLHPPAMLCHALPCFAMHCHALPCIAMHCHALPCFAMLCHAFKCFCMLLHTFKCFYMLLSALQAEQLPRPRRRACLAPTGALGDVGCWSVCLFVRERLKESLGTGAKYGYICFNNAAEAWIMVNLINPMSPLDQNQLSMKSNMCRVILGVIQARGGGFYSLKESF